MDIKFEICKKIIYKRSKNMFSYKVKHIILRKLSSKILYMLLKIVEVVETKMQFADNHESLYLIG